MMNQQQAAKALQDMLTAYRHLNGRGGAAIRAQHGLYMDDDRNVVKGRNLQRELLQEQRIAEEQLEESLSDEAIAGLEDLLYRVAAVTGLSPDSNQVVERLIDDYGLDEVEGVRPLLRTVARRSKPRGTTLFHVSSQVVRDISAIWRPYDYWNAALAETVFSGNFAGRAVYLDMEPEVLQQAAVYIWPSTLQSGDDAVLSFRDTVRRTCVGEDRDLRSERDRSRSNRFDLDKHARRLERWHRERQSQTDSTEPPPSIAILALFALAAERMQSDGDMAGTNYYGRLAEVLNVPGDRQTQLGDKYREHALSLWESLNVWLRDHHGQRGMPTAVSFGHQPYISLPISQALIRAQERERLSEFFTSYQFNPGQQVAKDDMVGMLSRWIPNSGVTGLRNAWRRGPDMQRRIAEVVCTELEHWQGEPPTEPGTGMQQRSLLLAASWFEEPEPEFDPFLFVRSSDSDSMSGAFRTADGTTVRVERDLDGLITLNAGGHDSSREQALLEVALSSGLRLQRHTRDISITFKNHPVIALLFDQLRQLYIQSSRVELGQDMLLLVDWDLAANVRQALVRSAEPGFREVTSDVHGLPDRWTLFCNVRLHSSPTVAGEEFLPLQPVSRTQVALEGGVQLSDGRWHTQEPPSIIAVDGRSQEFQVTLLPLSNQDEKVHELGTHIGQARIQLSGVTLADGDYRIVLSDTTDAEITSRALKLRSGSTAHLDPPMLSSARLGHAADPMFSPRSAISAESLLDPAAVMRGAVIDQGTGLRKVPETRLHPELGNMEPFESIEAWVRRYTGTTKEVDLEQARAYLRLGFVEHEDGELVRTKAGTLHMHKVRPRNRVERRSSASTGLMSPDLGVDLDLILDALAVMDAGSWNAFRRLINHSQEERYKPHEALRTLRSLSYIDVEVNPRNVAPQRWSLSPTALVALPSRTSAVLTGHRTSELIERLLDAADVGNAQVDKSSDPGRPTRFYVEAEHPGVLQSVADTVGVPLMFDIPRRILERMPTIQDILASQPELLVPEGCTFERFNRAGNRWVEQKASSERLAGSYRIRFPTGERRHAVWAEGVWRECGNATAKYAGAAAVGEHIMAYDEDREELTCLFGARPPGLFERALILCSGELPQTPGDHRSIYTNVPDNVHRWIAAKLGPAGWSH